MEAVIEWLAWYRDSPNRKDNLGQTVSPAHKIDFSLAEPLTIPGVSDVKDENLFSAPDLMGENVEDKKGVSIKGELGAVSPGSGDCVENAASDAVRENRWWMDLFLMVLLFCGEIPAFVFDGITLEVGSWMTGVSSRF
ncbi:hypothetical protein U1Q18_003342 [Sarracenia purpurea var. burkii]